MQFALHPDFCIESASRLFVYTSHAKSALLYFVPLISRIVDHPQITSSIIQLVSVDVIYHQFVWIYQHPSVQQMIFVRAWIPKIDVPIAIQIQFARQHFLFVQAHMMLRSILFRNCVHGLQTTGALESQHIVQHLMHINLSYCMYSD